LAWSAYPAKLFELVDCHDETAIVVLNAGGINPTLQLLLGAELFVMFLDQRSNVRR
jgi:hypothetical protein